MIMKDVEAHSSHIILHIVHQTTIVYIFSSLGSTSTLTHTCYKTSLCMSSTPLLPNDLVHFLFHVRWGELWHQWGESSSLVPYSLVVLHVCFLYIFNFGLSLYTFDSRCGHSIATSLAKFLSVRSHLLGQHSIVKMFHYGLIVHIWALRTIKIFYLESLTPVVGPCLYKLISLELKHNPTFLFI